MDGTKQTTDEPCIKPRVKYMVDVMIPPECMDEDGADCPHTKKEIKREFNPV